MGTETVEVRGADALEYLDGQVTQTLTDLAVGARTETLLLDPTGTIVAVAVVRRPAEDALTLEVPEGLAAASLARLERFAIRAAASFEASATEAADPVLGDERSRILAGIPGAAELARGLVPHGLGASLLARTVSFTKGCYPGQELVARMASRHATPPFVLRGLVTAEPIEPRDEVGDPSRAGAVTSVARDGPDGTVALCVLHRRDATGETVEVRHDGSAVMAQLVEDPSVRS